MFFAFLLLIVGLFLLGYAANYMIGSSVRIAKYFRISPLLIGLTVVAIGTSAPELFLSAMAALKGSGSLSVGNVIGSNIFNLGFILGLSAIVAPILIQKKLVYRDGVFFLFVTCMVLVMLWDQQVLRREWVILLSSLVGYVTYLWVKKDPPSDEIVDVDYPKLKSLCYLFMWLVWLSLFHTAVVDWVFHFSFGMSVYAMWFLTLLVLLFVFVLYKKDIPQFHKLSEWRILNFLKLLTSIGLLIVSAEHIVSAAVYIAQVFGISEWAIGATIVAAGTSLPEIAATVAAIMKKRYDMGVGNVIGSDIFNILWIIGISSVITPLTLSPTCIIISECDTNMWTMLFRDNIFSVWVLLVTLAITFLFMRTGRRLSRTEWIILFSFALLRMTFEINPNFFVRFFGW